MKICGVYNDTAKNYFLHLIEDNGRYILEVVDSKGNWITNLVMITPKKGILFLANVNKACGFDLDENGRVKIQEEGVGCD